MAALKPRRIRAIAADVDTARERLDDLHVEFGWALRQARRRLGLSQKELSARFEVNESYISLIESGQRHPRKELFDRLVDLFGGM